MSAAFLGGNLTVFVTQSEMPYVSENQGHRWRDWLDNNAVRQILENAAENIAWAWRVDEEYPKSYPVNTGQLLYEIKTRIEESLKPKKRLSIRKGSKQLLRPRPPESFSELIEDRAVQVVYEDQNSGTYKNALVLASRGDRSTFRKIMRAIENVYVMDLIGPGALPRPKTQFLHRNILQIAKVSGLDQKDEGILEFLDDLCPCGTKHQLDAIRKLRKRLG